MRERDVKAAFDTMSLRSGNAHWYEKDIHNPFFGVPILTPVLDDSSSMSDEEGGKRIETLTKTMKKITMVYDLARPAPDQGLVSVKFINCMKGYKNIDNRRVSPVLKRHAFWGTTQIGSALQKKVLDNFVFNPIAPMEKPLLIMTVTDGGVGNLIQC